MGESQRGLARQSTKSKAATKTTKSDCDRDKGFEKQRTAGKLRTMIMTRAKAVVTLALLFLFASAAGKLAFAAELVEVKTNDALAELAQNMISSDGVLKNISMWITANVTDLTPLSGLKHIKGGKLDVSYTTNLASLAPLENLEVINGGLRIYRNDALTDIPLPSLIEVGGNLGVRDNDVLASVSLPKLNSVGGHSYVEVHATTNDALAELAKNMISSDGVLKNVTMWIAVNVTDLTPLSGLKHIKGGGLLVSDTTNLASLAPLENLEVIDGDLGISDNEALTEIPLPSLTEVSWYLDVRDNDVLASVSLPKLNSAGSSVRIQMLPTEEALNFFAGFSVASVGGDIPFEWIVATDAEIAELAQQISSDGILDTQNATIVITANVTDLTPLSGLKHIKGGKLDVSDTTKLVSLAPLENLEVVDGDLVISDNEALTDVSLPSLTEVGRDLRVSDNDVLASVSLPKLDSVGGYSYVEVHATTNDVLAELAQNMISSDGVLKNVTMNITD